MNEEDFNPKDELELFEEIGVDFKSLEELLECHRDVEIHVKKVLDKRDTPEFVPDYVQHEFVIIPQDGIYRLIISLYKNY